ncbi:MAG: pyruvate, phosphate dikinase [Deltaproteobacteria bacterium]|nr:pyruvate, phosphate dikinase [Deltaproteobacteria bacterium]
MAQKHVYSFGGGKTEGNGTMKDILGGKGAGLAEMAKAKIPVPPGFTITTGTCLEFDRTKTLSPAVKKEILEAVASLEKRTGKEFGGGKNPLLVSVRSGAKVSMPGMMDTILNLGLTDETVEALAAKTNNPRFAYDSYRRFLQMFGDVVLGVEHHDFEHELAKSRKKYKAKTDADLSEKALRELVETYKKLIWKTTGKSFSQDPKTQLFQSIEAVFGSWSNPRAITYRRLNEIPHDIGTACNVQAMVFGNRGDTSGTGVGFTRDPATGERYLYGEFLMNAQGEDVVAGIRTPQPLLHLKQVMPKAFKQLAEIAENLERYYKDMQDFEFTIEDGELFMLQTRSGKRTGLASVRIATEMVDEGLITKKMAVQRVEPTQLLQLLHPVFDPAARKKYGVDAKGLNASPGAASGEVVFTADEAVARTEKGKAVVLVRQETSPEDIHGMAVAKGVLTAAGGMTSHAAVVGRQMGKPSVVGCDALRIDMAKGTLRIGGKTLRQGDPISIDGTTGEVICAALPTTPSEVVQAIQGNKAARKKPLFKVYDKLMSWADEYRKLKVRANADSGVDARRAVGFGAEGIGLCRTEHMFFEEDRLPWMKKMILSESDKERAACLKKILPMQRKDFTAIFKEMGGRPVTIRLLDPPLHEFLPRHDELKVEIAVMKATKKKKNKDGVPLAELEALLERVEELSEFNPMLGWRGCRLGLLVPEIIEMQARAIFEAAVQVKQKGIDVKPEVMIPLVGEARELAHQRAIVVRVAQEVLAKKKVKLAYQVGTMIEVPRGALLADEVAKEAEFFSFGTNDLTQMTFGFSRDDAGKFLSAYVEKGILPRDPFVSVDVEGVGQLMKMAVAKGRGTRPNMKCGICGEHGGEPRSVAFCHSIGLNYVSCSPFRIPVARLAAAQANLAEKAAARNGVKKGKAKKAGNGKRAEARA